MKRFGRRVRVATIILSIAIVLPMTPGSFAQSPPDSPGIPPASIKHSHGEPPHKGLSFDLPHEYAYMHTGLPLGSPVAGHFVARDASLRYLMQNAFDVQDYQILNGPDWIDGEGYDLDIQVDVSRALRDRTYVAPTPESLRPRLQALLEHKFALKVHRETRQLPVYQLIAIAPLNPPPPKPGVCVDEDRIKPSARDDSSVLPCGHVVFTVAPSGGIIRLPPYSRKPDGTPVASSGARGVTSTAGPFVGWLQGGRATMRNLAFTLSDILDAGVIDRTGFSGTREFDVSFEVSLQELWKTFRCAAFNPPYNLIVEYSDEVVQHPPSIFDALEKAGMKLVPATEAVDVLVIDRLEKLPGV